MESTLVSILIGLVSFFGVAFLALGMYYMKRRDTKQDELTKAVSSLDKTVVTLSGWMKDHNRRLEVLEGEESKL